MTMKTHGQLRADGNGPTLELIAPDLDNDEGENWDACAAPGFEYGTPATA